MRTPRHRIQFRINGQQTTDNRQQTTDNKRNVVRCFFVETRQRHVSNKAISKNCFASDLRNFAKKISTFF